MTAPDGAPEDAIAFAERTLELLDEGRFVATYKFAVLLGLIEVCQELATATGGAPAEVSTRDLAAKVTELYWPHTREFPPASAVLRQNSGGQAEIVGRIARFRELSVGDASAPLSQARRSAPAAFGRLVEFVEWKLIEMPLPRLQLIGATHEPFIYEVAWDTTVTRAEARAPGFDARLHFVGSAGEHLIQLAGLLRPLIQRHWALTLARFNKDRLEESEFDEFLFGATRVPLERVSARLRELADGRCFYCGSRVRARGQIDHFIPWARHPDNGIENLVFTDQRCNNDKRAFLASAEHVEGWAARFGDPSLIGQMTEIAEDRAWERHPDRTLSVARSIYLRLPDTARLWVAPRTFVPVDGLRLQLALATGL